MPECFTIMNNDNNHNTIQEFDVNLICDFFLNTNRQGPGSPEATLKALSFINNLTVQSPYRRSRLWDRRSDNGIGTTYTGKYYRTRLLSGIY